MGLQLRRLRQSRPLARRNTSPSISRRGRTLLLRLPYNDVTNGTTKPEAPMIVPWFREHTGNMAKASADRWIQIYSKRDPAALATPSGPTAGPFATDQLEYVFGQRPPP